MSETLRVAALQYYIRPVESFERFADQVQALVATAADYKARLVVFPEYFTVQLLTLGEKFDVRAFHDEVLAHGSVPLPVLDETVGAWIEAQKTKLAAQSAP